MFVTIIAFWLLASVCFGLGWITGVSLPPRDQRAGPEWYR